MKKGLLFLLIIAIICCAAAGLAEQEPEWVYSANQGGIGQYNGAGGDVVVPEVTEDHDVRAVGDAVFRGNAGITGLTIPAAVRSIGNSCINDCANLETVTLSEGLQSIEYNNFVSLPKLTEVTVPSTVVVIDYSFSWCDNLKKITFLGACPMIASPDLCFDVLPDDLVVYVPDDQLEEYRAAFKNLKPNQIQPSGQNAILHDFTPAPETIAFDAATGTVTGYTGDSLRVDLPAQIDGVQVKAIGMHAFENSHVLWIDIPEGVTEINSMAFDGARDLLVIKLPDSLKTIGSYAFDKTKAGHIRWGNGLEEIGEGAFRYAMFGTELALPDSLRVIGEEAFLGATLSEAYMGGQVESIGPYAFVRTNLRYLAIDAYTMIDVGENAFSGTWLEDIDLPWDSDQNNQQAWQAMIDAQVEGCKVWINNPTDCETPADGACKYADNEDGTLYLSAYTGDQESLVLYHSVDGVQVTAIGEGAFRGNQTLKKYRVTHNDTFTTIGKEAFAGSAVEVVDLYYTTETIGEGAFRDCVNLTEITLPASLKTIGSEAFAGCANLATVNILCDPAIIPEDAFTGTAYAAASAVEVPIAEMPMAANRESDFEFDVETGTITSYIGEAVDVVIPREIGGITVRAIGQNAFDRCRVYTDTDIYTNQTTWQPLRSVVIPETVETIADSAFSYCQQLQLVICYAPLENTGRSIFMLCRDLRNVLFVNGIGEIDNYCFEHCEALQHVYWGDHMRRIGENAFNHMGLQSLVIDAEIVDEGAFNHSSLQDVTLTDRVREIHSGAFYACEGLNSITCLFSDAERFVDGGPFGGVPQTGVTTVFPSATTEEQLQALNRKLNVWNGGHLGNGNEITLQDPAVSVEEMPDPEKLYFDLMASDTIPEAPQPTHETPVQLPEPVSDINAVLGSWKLSKMAEGGEEYDVSLFGLEMTLTLNADGSGEVVNNGEANPAPWIQEDGILYFEDAGQRAPFSMDAAGSLIMYMGDGSQMIFVRDAAQTAEPAPGNVEDTFIPVKPEQYMPMVGEWYCIWVDAGGGQFNPRKDNGYEMNMTINADGTAYLTNDNRDPQLTSYNGYVMFGMQPLELLEDGLYLHLGATGSGSMYFCKDPDAEIPEKYRHGLQDYVNSIAPATPEPAAAPSTDQIPGELLMDVKYVATTYATGGHSYDASILGAEYAVTLHADGTCELVFSGFTVPGVQWSLDGDTIHLAYAAGYDCTMNGDALELDFSGAMLLHMVPQQ